MLLLQTSVLAEQVLELFLVLQSVSFFLFPVDQVKIILLPLHLHPLLLLEHVGISLDSGALVPLDPVGALDPLLALYHSVVVPLQLLHQLLKLVVLVLQLALLEYCVPLPLPISPLTASQSVSELLNLPLQLHHLLLVLLAVCPLLLLRLGHLLISLSPSLVQVAVQLGNRPTLLLQLDLSLLPLPLQEGNAILVATQVVFPAVQVF